jgi:hypothetical protein
VVLVRCALTGRSGVGFYLRVAEQARRAGGGVYTDLDPETRWPCSAPPSVLALFVVLNLLGTTGAGLVWAIVNVAALGGVVACVLGVARHLGRDGEGERP